MVHITLGLWQKIFLDPEITLTTGLRFSHNWRVLRERIKWMRADRHLIHPTVLHNLGFFCSHIGNGSQGLISWDPGSHNRVMRSAAESWHFAIVSVSDGEKSHGRMSEQNLFICFIRYSCKLCYPSKSTFRVNWSKTLMSVNDFNICLFPAPRSLLDNSPHSSWAFCNLYSLPTSEPMSFVFLS